MKLGNFADSYASANNFTFTNNPKSYNISNGTQKRIIASPLRSISPYINVSAVKPFNIVLTGVLTGTERATELGQLSDMVYSKGLKKLWIDGTYFIPLIGSNINRANLAKRANFIDYTVSLNSPIPFFWNTEITKTFTTIGETTTDLAGFTNDGYGPSIIYKIVVTATQGVVTGFEIGDLAKDGSDVDGDNILSWVGGSLSVGEYLTLYLIYDINRKGLKWYYFKGTDDSASYGTRDWSGDNFEDGLRVIKRMTGGTTQTFSAVITGTSTPQATIAFNYYNSDYMR